MQPSELLSTTKLSKRCLAIEPQCNIGTKNETRHVLCSDEEADIFAVYRLTGIEGDAELMADFFNRLDAERYIQHITG